MKKNFVVTQKDISKARRIRREHTEPMARCCPVYQCLIRRGVPVLRVLSTFVSLKNGSVGLSPEVSAWIKVADDKKWKDLETLRFSLDLPEALFSENA
jgi:hypothetical protein